MKVGHLLTLFGICFLIASENANTQPEEQCQGRQCSHINFSTEIVKDNGLNQGKSNNENRLDENRSISNRLLSFLFSQENSYSKKRNNEKIDSETIHNLNNRMFNNDGTPNTNRLGLLPFPHHKEGQQDRKLEPRPGDILVRELLGKKPAYTFSVLNRVSSNASTASSINKPQSKNVNSMPDPFPLPPKTFPEVTYDKSNARPEDDTTENMENQETDNEETNRSSNAEKAHKETTLQTDYQSQKTKEDKPFKGLNIDPGRSNSTAGGIEIASPPAELGPKAKMENTPFYDFNNSWLESEKNNDPDSQSISSDSDSEESYSQSESSSNPSKVEKDETEKIVERNEKNPSENISVALQKEHSSMTERDHLHGHENKSTNDSLSSEEHGSEGILPQQPPVSLQSGDGPQSELTLNNLNSACWEPYLYEPCQYYPACFIHPELLCSSDDYIADDVNRMCEDMESLTQRQQNAVKLRLYFRSVENCVNYRLMQLLRSFTCDAVTLTLSNALLQKSHSNCWFQNGLFCEVISDPVSSISFARLFSKKMEADSFMKRLLVTIEDLTTLCE